jgi:hypothetical protein
MICIVLRQGITIIAFQTTYGTKFSLIKVSDVIRGKGGMLEKLEFVRLGKYLWKKQMYFCWSALVFPKNYKS